MLQVNEFTVTELFCPVRHLARHNVRVDVYFHADPYFFTGGSMTVPHLEQVRSSVLLQNRSITGGNCFTISFTNRTSSWSLLPQFSQNHMNASFSSSSSSLTFSITRPTVFAPRWGECGVLGGSKNMSPSLMGIDLGIPSSIIFRTIFPSTW